MPLNAFHILDRELRTRARKPFTVWGRVAIAGVAMLMALSWFQNTAALGNPAQSGQMVFNLLAWLCFGFCLLEGARQTSNAISLERREGTLAWLFLTELSGLDVVLGKLAAASLQSFYGLLAAFPVLGITLAAGGVTAGEFWRTQLALVTTLGLAATAGLCISAHSRDETRAALASLGLVLGLCLAPCLIDVASGSLRLPSLSPAAGLWFAGDVAYRVAPARFWITQLVVLGLAMLLLIAAGHRTSRAWREQTPQVAPRPRRKVRESWHYRIPPRLHASPYDGSLETEPAAWLAGRERGVSALVWSALVMPLLGLLAMQFALRFFRSAVVMAGMLSFLHLGLEFVCVTLLALAASHSAVRARREGALELLLCTPVQTAEIVRGYWRAFWRRLRWPFAMYALTPVVLYLWFWVAQGPAGARPPWAYLLFGQAPRWTAELVRMLAVGWLGVWFGFTTGNLGPAIGRTLLAALVVPWVAATTLSVLLGTWMTGASRTGVTWWHWLVWAVPSLFSLVWSLGMIRWARARLFRHLREAVTYGAAPASLAAPWIRWWSMKST